MIDIDLQVQHHFSSGVYAKQMTLPAGHFAISHKHTYDHLSILSQGKALVETDSDRTVYVAPACVTIAAGVTHKITAIDETVWFCIHATDEVDVDLVDAVLIEGN